MTKLIVIAIVALVLFGGCELFLYWDKVQNEKAEEQKQAGAPLRGEMLAGMPFQLQSSLERAQQQGPAAFEKWLKFYGPKIDDPRKAWIELDYCVAISRDNPAEARRIFAEIKQRTPPSSRIWPRIKQLSKTYE